MSFTGLSQGASALDSLEKWQDAISKDIAYANKVGYRSAAVGFEGVSHGEMPSATHTSFVEFLKGVTPKERVQTSFAQGDLTPTENPHDFGINGSGFFELETEDGEKVYTRNGEFRFDKENTLVTNTGAKVMGEGGAISRQATGGEIAVNRNGVIFQDGQEIGRFKVVEIENLGALQESRDGFVGNGNDPLVTKDRENPEVYQGVVEKSNVSSVRRMMDLIQVLRAHEMNQKVITTFDQQMSQAIQYLSYSR